MVSTAADHLAATLLDNFPNNAVADPTIEDRRDTAPALLRRAIAFVDDNAHTDICLTDIAAAVFVTPGALQYIYRRHRDCTPMEYVRRVRLHYARRDLLVANCATATVGDIARRCGFAHARRFATLYRQHYGQSPHLTLKR